MVRPFERGFTLIETVVTVALIVLFLAAGGVWLLATRPGALAQAGNDYDAAAATAQALASTNGNGATLVFAPRYNGNQLVSGFTLRVYAGRPTAANAVSATTAMPVVADAAVSEQTFGSPPFAIFFGASGHVSGEAAYPAIDNTTGKATFATIATEPPCPSGGLVLTFTGPSNAAITRALPCATSVSSPPGMPNPSPTPNAPIVTPTALLYHWPADARQTFVATEWGYTHWFASATGFSCGNGIATYPDVLPSPYSAPQVPSEAQASPPPPDRRPFSYPNAGGGSMNDAPASFPLDPGLPGLCSASVADEYGQQAQTAVQVMGWLTAAYGGQSFTHASTPQLSLPSSAFPSSGASVTIALSKTFDSERLTPQVAFDANCSQYLGFAANAGTTPSSPSATPATSSITLTLANRPDSPITCGGTIFDQYTGSQSGEGVPFNASIGTLGLLQGLPPAIQLPVKGSPLQVNGQSCNAMAVTTAGVVWNKSNDGQGGALAHLVASNVTGFDETTGCYTGALGVVANEDGMPSADHFTEQINTCEKDLTSRSPAWTPQTAAGPTATLNLAELSTAVAGDSCSFSITDSSNRLVDVGASVIGGCPAATSAPGSGQLYCVVTTNTVYKCTPYNGCNDDFSAYIPTTSPPVTAIDVTTQYGIWKDCWLFVTGTTQNGNGSTFNEYLYTGIPSSWDAFWKQQATNDWEGSGANPPAPIVSGCP